MTQGGNLVQQQEYGQHEIHDPIASTHSVKVYQEMYNYSINEPEKFWTEQAYKYLHWFRKFDQVTLGSFHGGNVSWFLNGQLNASVNCIDKHLPHRFVYITIILRNFLKKKNCFYL